MIRSYRLRRVIEPTKSLIRTVGVLMVGLAILALGVGLVFKSIILPSLLWLSHEATVVVSRIVAPANVDETKWVMGGLMLVIGFYCVIQGARFALSHVLGTLDPGLKMGKMGDAYFKKQQLAQGPRVVAIGGGTGLSTLLRGLKSHTSNITAIVTVTDDGGSSGKLIRDKGMIPPGDIRNCLVALADAEKSMTDLFQHRFKKDSGSLSGHSMGNLLIAALVDQAHGDFEKAIEIASDVLAIRGRVIPSTLAHVNLRAELEDGTEVAGETAIVEQGKKIKRIFLQPELCDPTREALEAIRTADLIVIGPGSVYTSVIPNLLVRGVPQALKESKALKVYVCNVMTQPGESDSFTASEHVSAILQNVDGRAFDYVLINKALPTSESLNKYAEYGQQFVEPDIDRIRTMGMRPIAGDLMSDTDVVRHDPVKLAAQADEYASLANCKMTDMNPGRLVVLSGPSGVGKDTVIDRWRKANPNVQRVVSFTTRDPRPGEQDGIDYRFVSRDDFLQRAQAGNFLEYKEVYGNFYATPLADLEEMLNSGAIAVLKIDVQGALTVMELREDALSVFLLPPDRSELIRRIKDRGTEEGAVLDRRIEKAQAEMDLADHYKFQVVNDNIDQAVRELQEIVNG